MTQKPLTPTEQRVVDLIAGDLLSYQAAAAVLGWKPRTVRWYVAKIIADLERYQEIIPSPAPPKEKLIAHFARKVA